MKTFYKNKLRQTARLGLGGCIYTLMLFGVGIPPVAAAPPRSNRVPLLFRQQAFSSATLAEAVNHYVFIGEDASIKELSSIYNSGGRGIYADSRLRIRISWVCRILFQSSSKQPLRQPYLGGLDLPWLSMPAASWPIYPLVHTGISYFVLSDQYSFGGVGGPESMDSYMKYCRSHGTFRRFPIAVPTRNQALHDLSLLRMSHPWQTIRWTYHSIGVSYNFNESEVWNFLEDQASNIPLR